MIIQHLKEEFQKYNILKKQATTLRHNFLEQLAEAQAEASDGKKEKIYKRLMLHESIRSMFRKIKFATKDVNTGVTIVEAPNEAGEWVPVTD